MQLTVVAVMCHMLGTVVAESVGTQDQPFCREVVVIRQDMPMQACMLSQPALAEWKANSIYRRWLAYRPHKMHPGRRLRAQGARVG